MIPELTMPFTFDDTIPGWLLPEEAMMLARMAQGCHCLEIGAYRGRSTCVIAQTAEFLHTIDPCWPKEDQQVLPDLWANLLRHNLADKVMVHVGESQRLLECANRPIGSRYGFVFIDGNHENLGVTRDICNVMFCADCEFDRFHISHCCECGRTGNPNYLALHDYDNATWPGVKRAADKLIGPPDQIVGSMGIYDFTERSLECRVGALNATG